MTTVSVIVPCFNQGGYLADCLESITSQQGVDLEVLVVDDGSTDQTADVARRACLQDGRIRYFRKQNGGISSARNLGLLAARGDYVKLLDADDLLAPGSLALQSAYLSEHPDCDLAYGVSRYFSDGEFGAFRHAFALDGEESDWISEIGDSPAPWLVKLLRRNIMPVCSPLFRRALIQRVGLFDMRLRHMEDWDFWIRAVVCGCQFRHVRSFGTVAYIRTHPSSMTCNSPGMMKGEYAMRCIIHAQLSDSASRALNTAMLLGLARRLQLSGDSSPYCQADTVLTGLYENFLLRINILLNRYRGGVSGRLLRSLLPWRIRHSLSQAGLHF